MTLRRAQEFFQELYHGFEMPLSRIDCGMRCGPHNDYGVPVCCDIQMVVPSAFEEEWSYLKENTDLWKPWRGRGLGKDSLADEVQDGQVLLECKGYQECQRPFRTLTCRAFPFFPYLNSQGRLLGLAYYPDFKGECWIISNLSVVSSAYKAAFRHTYEQVFRSYPSSRTDYQDFSLSVRQAAASQGEVVVLLDFDGEAWLIDPSSERLMQADYKDLDAFGPYAVTRDLKFPDEIEDDKNWMPE